jgi:hypothetical protein
MAAASVGEGWTARGRTTRLDSLLLVETVLEARGPETSEGR